MPQREKITEKYNIALKSRDKTLISTFRLILSSIKDADIAKRTDGKKELLNDQEINQILRKMLKQRNESADIYKKANRTELLENELKRNNNSLKSFYLNYSTLKTLEKFAKI